MPPPPWTNLGKQQLVLFHFTVRYCRFTNIFEDSVIFGCQFDCLLENEMPSKWIPYTEIKMAILGNTGPQKPFLNLTWMHCHAKSLTLAIICTRNCVFCFLLIPKINQSILSLWKWNLENNNVKKVKIVLIY